MRHIAVVIAALAAFVHEPVYSQTQQGAWELSLSRTFGSVSTSTETSGSFGSSSTDSEAEGYLTLALRPGFFIIDGLALEPEILWTAIEGEPPSFMLSGNLAYTFSIPESRVLPFVLAGYGTGNAIPLFQTLLFRSSDKLDISVLNIGGGLKVLIAERVAIRTEYRYQRFSQKTDFGFGPYGGTAKSTTNFHNVLIGFSVFLP